jgi:MFS family permease
MAFSTTEQSPPKTASPSVWPVSRRYAWVVFALSFGLLLSDYMSRQVLNAVFPMLKAEWLLSDAELGSLSGVVALTVGVLAFPLSLLADRWGRVRSLLIAATVWSLATLGCAVSAGYGEMMIGRLFVGIGEAAYGSVGIAVVLSVFPPVLRATLSGAFIAGGAFGSVLGVSIGGAVAEAFGWRWAFGVMGVFGLVLAACYGVVVTEKRLRPRAETDPDTRNAADTDPDTRNAADTDADTRNAADADAATGARPEADTIEDAATAPREHLRALLPRLFSSVSVIGAYVGSGLQLFIAGALIAWLPSYFDRYYHLPTAQAGAAAGVFALVIGVGMIGGGIVSDRISKARPIRKWSVAIVCSLGSLVLLLTAFHLPVGSLQIMTLAAGAVLSAGTAGPAAAMVANLTPATIAATAFATLTLANSLLGLAPGPAVTGMLADRTSLLDALRLVPLVALVATVAFVVGRHHYERDLLRITELSGPAGPERTRTEVSS